MIKEQDMNMLDKLHISDRKRFSQKAIDQFASSRPLALEVDGSDIYVEGPIFDEATAGFYREFLGDDTVVTPKGMREALSEINGDVTIKLNSPGGSVYDASSIATMLQERAAETSVHVVVTGMCASAATYFLLYATQSSIAKMGTVMIHNAWGSTIGDRHDHMDQAKLLEKIDKTYAEAMAELMEADIKDVMAAMDKETWYSADEAVRAKLVDGPYEPKSGADDNLRDAPRRRLQSLTQQLMG